MLLEKITRVKFLYSPIRGKIFFLLSRSEVLHRHFWPSSKLGLEVVDILLLFSLYMITSQYNLS